MTIFRPTTLRHLGVGELCARCGQLFKDHEAISQFPLLDGRPLAKVMPQVRFPYPWGEQRPYISSLEGIRRMKPSAVGDQEWLIRWKTEPMESNDFMGWTPLRVYVHTDPLLCGCVTFPQERRFEELAKHPQPSMRWQDWLQVFAYIPPEDYADNDPTYHLGLRLPIFKKSSDDAEEQGWEDNFDKIAAPADSWMRGESGGRKKIHSGRQQQTLMAELVDSGKLGEAVQGWSNLIHPVTVYSREPAYSSAIICPQTKQLVKRVSATWQPSSGREWREAVEKIHMWAVQAARADIPFDLWKPHKSFTYWQGKTKILLDAFEAYTFELAWHDPEPLTHVQQIPARAPIAPRPPRSTQLWREHSARDIELLDEAGMLFKLAATVRRFTIAQAAAVWDDYSLLRKVEGPVNAKPTHTWQQQFLNTHSPDEILFWRRHRTKLHATPPTRGQWSLWERGPKRRHWPVKPSRFVGQQRLSSHDRPIPYTIVNLKERFELLRSDPSFRPQAPDPHGQIRSRLTLEDLREIRANRHLVEGRAGV